MQSNYAKLSQYWQQNGIPCDHLKLPYPLNDSELDKAWSIMGMPRQSWWLFSFHPPEKTPSGQIKFGNVGSKWDLLYDTSNGSCVFTDKDKRERFANSSIGAFAECLTLFNEANRRIQIECSGDSGADWDRGDQIMDEIERSMRAVDSRAFESEDNLWPVLLID